MDLAAALWFPDERTVVEFEPRFPFWCEEFDAYDPEPADRAFGAVPMGDAEPPEPLEYCFVAWQDLAEPATVVDHIRSSFGRASRRTGVRPFDLTRPRRKPVTQQARAYLASATPDQPS